MPRAQDIYKQNAKPMVYEESSLKDVIIEISKGRLGATAVVEKNNSLKGVITDGDVRRMLEKTNDVTSIKAKDIYNTNPKQSEAGLLAVEAFELLKQFDISQLIVTDTDGIYLGILHLHDLIREGII